MQSVGVNCKPDILCVVGADAKFELNTHESFRGALDIEINYLLDCSEIDSWKSQLMTFKNNNNANDCLQTQLQILYVVKNFHGGTFEYLTQNKCSILGTTALLQLIELNKPIYMVASDRPLHNLAMRELMICFSGITSKNEAQHLLTLTRWMGAQSRGEVTQKTTHLVAGNARGAKYRRAAELGVPIMTQAWVTYCYEHGKSQVEFFATSPNILLCFKQKPFHGLRLAFLGFEDDDVAEMTDLTISNDGIVLELSDTTLSHVIVNAISGDEQQDCHSDPILAQLRTLNHPSTVYTVYREWFWASLEMVCRANEELYLVPGFKTLTRRSSQFANRRSSSLGGSAVGALQSSFNILSPLLDYSKSPDSMGGLTDMRITRSSLLAQDLLSTPTRGGDICKQAQFTERHKCCLELLQTERNYVHVLETIVTIFKEPLERPDPGQPHILDATELKVIFGNLIPIYEVHKRMLKDLEQFIELDWKETNCIGRIFVTHSMDILKAYPPFVNFFEETKKTIVECDAKYPRFHAFLRKCQSKKECNRECLTEMIIRPVQRLASITLLIKALIKGTDDSNPDKRFLQEALERVRRVMNLINEDKRKTEGQIAMFDIVNDIEQCPPYLLSSNRKFVCKVEARLLVQQSSGQIAPHDAHKIMLFVFSDMLEICKMRTLKRSQSASMKLSVSGYRTLERNLAMNLRNSSVTGKKQYRHLDDLGFDDIKFVYSRMCESIPSYVIVIQARPSNKYQNFRTYPLMIDDKNWTKDKFIANIRERITTMLVDDYASAIPVPNSNSSYGDVNNDDTMSTTTTIINTPMQQIEEIFNETPLRTEDLDFRYADTLINLMSKSCLSRVLSIRQTLLSPSVHHTKIHPAEKAHHDISTASFKSTSQRL